MELDWLKRWNLYSPENIAIKDGETGREFSYANLFKLANQGAHLLQERYGVKKGARVAVLATNELEYVFLFFALQRLGAIMVPVNFRLTQREVDHIVTDSAPELILFQEAFRPLIENLPAEIKAAKLLLQDGENSKESFASLLLKSSSVEYPFTNHEEDPVMILYTSGTTGAPKGAVLTYKMIFWNSINTTIRLNISQSDCTVIFLPFFHTGGWNVLTTPFMHRGAKVVFLKKFDADQILQLSAQEKATILFGVPTTMDMMARSPLFE